MENCCFAAVDMGTNSFHMIIARLKSNGSIKIIDREKTVIRLGSHKGKELSFISDEETELAIRVLTKFKKLADTYGAEFRAVATSAVREANNRIEFISKVKKSTGIIVEAIEGKKEAELIYLGAEKALSLSDKNTLCIDIGGGSTEIINVNKNDTVFAESIKVGAVRLSKLFFPDYKITKEKISECSQYIESLLNNSLKKYFKYHFGTVVGTSGTIEALALIILKQKREKIPRTLNSVCFTKSELGTISNKILDARTKEDRLKIHGMEEKRADIIPPGVLILNKIFELFGIEEIRISAYALREGIILDMINKYKLSSD
jgi:exopolyphosphatase/guanosine-5'-triphosphate,3'-diphosphate pyrophosphatase